MKAPGCRGAALPIVDVTIPGRASFLDGISVTFSLMPLFLGLLTVVGMFWTRRLSLLCAVLLWLVLLVACEMLKGIVPGDRPFGSCATSSGHGPTVVITAFAFLAWLMLEMAFHQPHILRLFKLGYIIGACMLLGPIPAARARLRDHTPLQLGIGIVIGLAAGLLWFLLMRYVIGGHILRWIGLLKARVKCIQFINIKNDYFAKQEDYDEQTRRYKEGGVDAEEVAELGETAAEGNNAEHDRAHADIFGAAGEGGGGSFSDASVVSNLEDIFGESTEEEEGGTSPAGDNADKESNQRHKKKHKKPVADGGDSASTPGAGELQDAEIDPSAERPLNVATGVTGPNSGMNSSAGGNTSGTPDEKEEQQQTSPTNKKGAKFAPKALNSAVASSPTANSNAPSPTKSALKTNTSFGHNANADRGGGRTQ